MTTATALDIHARQLVLDTDPAALRRAPIRVHAHRVQPGQRGTVSISSGPWELDLRLNTAELRGLVTLLTGLADEMDMHDHAARLPATDTDTLTDAVGRMVREVAA